MQDLVFFNKPSIYVLKGIRFWIKVKNFSGNFQTFTPKKVSPKLFCYFFPCIIQPLGKMDDYGIASFGVSVTTLEEVFMKVGEGSEKTVDDL